MKRQSKFFGEFKKFILRGNVMDMAVGVIVGGAFTSIVTSLNADILTPILGISEARTFLTLRLRLEQEKMHRFCIMAILLLQ